MRGCYSNAEHHSDCKLAKDQAGFRPGCSCAGQQLNLTQHIEDGFECKLISGAAFIELTAAYDAVQHHVMIRKLLDVTGDLDLCQAIKSLLHNRRSFVQLNDKKSKWEAQKNGLPEKQGTGPSPLPHLHTNDQPLPQQCRRFIYVIYCHLCLVVSPALYCCHRCPQSLLYYHESPCLPFVSLLFHHSLLPCLFCLFLVPSYLFTFRILDFLIYP